MMVELLAPAHDRACEAELADIRAAALAADRQPDLAALRTRFGPFPPAAMPDAVIDLVPPTAYDANSLGSGGVT